MAGISIDSVVKRFDSRQGEITAVDDVDIDIGDGEFVVLVGPSGSGKSTLLRMVSGLEQQTEGDIWIQDELVNGMSPRDRDIAMVFQNYALYPNMSVRENMSFGLKMSTDLSGEEIEERVERVARTMDIENLLDNNPSQMSGGQRQRVALGRAIVRDPNAFLMDEPLSNLDAKLRTVMRTEINRLQSELDVTTLYVTHDQTEAMTMGDRLVVLNEGELQQIGTPLECFYRPENLFVASFIGSPSMNFFEAEREGRTLLADGFDYELSEDITASTEGHERVTIGVRPEDVEIRTGEESENGFRCQVDVVEPMGSIRYLYLKPVEQSHDGTFVVEIDGQRPVDEGEELYADIPAETMYLFDTETGNAIHHRTLTEEAESELSDRMADVGVTSE
ncbi:MULTISPECIES: sn-glycerol-3-phosphate ABC transporter ATP-binding protein UgpC [unclassified Haladaptatus]|uniref:ABC transporter ATP-binding protein n=1 Tax=unclassified Haladaptatus TaxID=2622732 RepID=UPI00209C6E15|nr:MULTISPECIES: sn-glycerol-3-phosphate ABC transporter ATP-binding protein UgpC [unclassified Haladaptatus]MCO8243710.1 sn-glycerol-3-phosphate ABC transporter ATP-binding protein UgpC [Haladaptatus sp. AB643]MCO8255119.1 sn-glycerol-3-phosphate ABC transporter ATP-binding protein UgpC [Haladaptatus sp. AB618]